MMIRSAEPKFGEEDIGQRGRVVLPGVDKEMIHMPIKLWNDTREADDFRASAENGDDPQRSNSSPMTLVSKSSIPCPARSSRTPLASNGFMPDEYSQSSFVCDSGSAPISGSIGEIT